MSIVDYLTETDENIYKIDFIHFRIRDMKTNKILFEVQRDPGMYYIPSIQLYFFL
jgi:hypothetical protein